MKCVPILAMTGALACALTCAGATGWQLDAPPACPGVTACRVAAPAVEWTAGPEGAVPRVAGGAHHGKPGEPDLPLLVRILPVPEGCVATVEFVQVEMRETNGVRVAPVPAQEIVEDGAGHLLRPAPADRSAVYSEDRYWPASPLQVEVADRGTQRWARVVFYPLQYNPVTGVVRWNRAVEARLIWRPAPAGR